ncbi:Flavonoid 3',5'-hydroxylase 1 [Apostasia shenzhenica]|uniref:Flavonoid 3',5'-hydroxylase 1 n=1 Tax=Apostasia shenzhenica TaxID=1088818 RepID=A0A2H9ZSL1_9ASPA|nr:Flavonoid 3',5'-hydroxylase 1 [Apostasia shenzhenica]
MDLYLISSVFLCFLIHLLIRRRLLPRRFLPLPPGPFNFPILGALPFIGPMPYSGLARLAHRYGPIMFLKMGTRRVVVASSPAAARTFLKTLDAAFSDRPSGVLSKEVAYNGRDMVFSDYNPNWKLLRKVTSLHLLGPKAMARWAAVRQDEAGRMLDSMLKLSVAGKPVTMPDLLVCTLANVIGRITVSQRVFDEEGKESKAFKEMIMELLVGEGASNIGDLVPAIRWLDPMTKKMWRIHHKLDRMLTELLTEHATTSLERRQSPDFIDLILADQPEGEDGEKLSLDSIKGLIADLFVAGTDTSSIVIEWAMAEMLRNPAILRRAQEEADSVIGRNRLLEESDIPNLPYLQAICKEALRKHPSTPLSIPHFSKEPCEIEGYRIPGETWLLVNIWAIGRHPDAWENPLEFSPERFVDGKMAKIEPLGNDFELIPFGAGRRICAGKHAGLLMVQYFLGTMVHSFEWSLPEGVTEIDMEEGPGLALPKAVPLAAMVRPRLAPAAYAGASEDK